MWGLCSVAARGGGGAAPPVTLPPALPHPTLLRSSDGCLYTETFALAYINKTVVDPKARSAVYEVMKFYFG